MWYLYLDESGDLGFDFVNKKPSKFFTVTILTLNGIEANRKLIKAVKMVLRRKLNPKGKRKRYERNRVEWFDIFNKEKVKFNTVYLSDK